MQASPRARPRYSTTPAAQKFYRSRGPLARQRVELKVGSGARLEWFPAETIVFERAMARSETRVELAAGATFSGWGITCLGRPSVGERFAEGRFHSSFALGRGQPLLCERLTVDEAKLLDQPWGLAGQPVYGTLYFAPAVPCWPCQRASGYARIWGLSTPSMP